MRLAGEQLLAEARAIRAAYPDGARLRVLPIRPLPEQTGWPALAAALAAALGCLRDEMVLVRDGKAGGVWVLDDEIARAEAVLGGWA